MSITTDHLGYTCRYNENSDTWTCGDLNIEAPTLSKLKERINKLDLAARRVDNVQVIVVSYGDSFDVRYVTSVEGDGGVSHSTYRGGQQVWTVRPHGARTLKREKEPLSKLILDTPENRALLDEYKRLRDIAKAADDAAKAALDAIPRATVKDLGLETKDNAEERTPHEVS